MGVRELPSPEPSCAFPMLASERHCPSPCGFICLFIPIDHSGRARMRGCLQAEISAAVEVQLLKLLSHADTSMEVKAWAAGSLAPDQLPPSLKDLRVCSVCV